MCLAVPMRLIEVEGARGVVESGGVSTRIVLAMTPDAKVGDFLLVHAGYSLSIVDETEALKTLELLQELSQEPS